MRSSWVALSCFVLAALGASARAEDTRAILGQIRGEVKVDGEAVTRARELREGARIKTGAGASCAILIGTSSAMQVGESSEVVITRKGSSLVAATVDLMTGKTRALVKAAPSSEADQAPEQRRAPKFYLRSRSAVMGVRGTEIFAQAPPSPREPALFATLSGRAELRVLTPGASSAPIPLGAGQAVRAGGGTPGAPLTAPGVSPAPAAPGAPAAPAGAPLKVESLSEGQMQGMVNETGGRAPTIRNQADFQNLSGGKPLGDQANAPPPGLPPPPPRLGTVDPVKDGRPSVKLKINAITFSDIP